MNVMCQKCKFTNEAALPADFCRFVSPQVVNPWITLLKISQKKTEPCSNYFGAINFLVFVCLLFVVFIVKTGK